MCNQTKKWLYNEYWGLSNFFECPDPVFLENGTFDYYIGLKRGPYKKIVCLDPEKQEKVRNTGSRKVKILHIPHIVLEFHDFITSITKTRVSRIHFSL